MGMGIGDGFRQLVGSEVGGEAGTAGAAGRSAAQAVLAAGQVDGVGAEGDRGTQTLEVAGRRKQFRPALAGWPDGGGAGGAGRFSRDWLWGVHFQGLAMLLQ
ncbi:hypothetical protein SDC9_196855 [bioreactor metagenome]|uniref:Uncharacterized protein n=1 Tax=bioreactor metagenome TaxID=1076179 RepID=A0A645IDN6_9ZZZZ